MIAIGRRTLLSAALALGTSLVVAGAQNDAARPGDKAPEFTLKDTTGKEHKLSEILAKDETKAVVLEWINADCPYVVRHYERDKTMATLHQKYKDKGVVWLAINTGAEGEQGAGRDRNHRAIGEWKIEYPILLDPTGDTARAYGAKTTPHMYVITADGTLAYAGGIDNDSRGNKEDSDRINYVEQALEAVLSGSTVETPAARPYGCSVKY